MWCRAGRRLWAAVIVAVVCLIFGRAGAQELQPKRQDAPQGESGVARQYIGFDRNDYPGDAALGTLRREFDFVGYWVTNPPGETSDTWLGKRALLAQHGFGFAVLANGRTDAEILRATKGNGRATKGTWPSAKALGEADAEAAVAATRREGFAAGTVVFLDQEEGGRMLPEQAAYLFGWTERVAAAGLRAGVYLSGQPVPDGDGRTITTAEDVQEHVASGGLHPVALWVYQDGCPPSNGCTVRPPALDASGTAEAVIWQFAQSPRRPAVTKACARTYAADGNCYAPGGRVYVDLDVAASADPSHGR